MGSVYQKLAENRRGKAGPVRVWVAVRCVAAKVVGLYVGRRRWTRSARRITWAALLARVRRTVGLPRARNSTASYDSVSYARNFDDGVWKEEEQEFWRRGSFSYRFGYSGRLDHWVS